MGSFDCPKCKAKTKVSFTEILDVGTPICAACDKEMELSSEEGDFVEPVEDPKKVPKVVPELKMIKDPEAFERLVGWETIGTRIRFHRRPGDDPQDAIDAKNHEAEFLNDNEIYTVCSIDMAKGIVTLVEKPGIYFESHRFEPLE